VSTFSDKIDYGPSVFTTLEMVETEVGHFSSSKTTTEQDGNDCSVALSLEGFGIRRLPQCARVLGGQPISQSDSKLLDSLYATDASGQLWAEQTRIGGFIRQSPDSSQPHIDCAGSQIPRFQVNAVPQYDRPVEREARFRTIPFDEFVNRMGIPTLRFGGPKAANDGGLGLIEVREAQSCLRFSDLSLFRVSSHAKPPPVRLSTRMKARQSAKVGLAFGQHRKGFRLRPCSGFTGILARTQDHE
jgi:hypothetical protein